MWAAIRAALRGRWRRGGSRALGMALGLTAGVQNPFVALCLSRRAASRPLERFRHDRSCRRRPFRPAPCTVPALRAQLRLRRPHAAVRMLVRVDAGLARRYAARGRRTLPLPRVPGRRDRAADGRRGPLTASAAHAWRPVCLVPIRPR